MEDDEDGWVGVDFGQDLPFWTRSSDRAKEGEVD